MATPTPTPTTTNVPTTVPTFKCVLLGDSQCGKTTFITKLLTGAYNDKYVPTLGVEVHPLTFKTTRGSIRFNVWDMAGQERYIGLGEAYYSGANCAIIMYDATSHESCHHIADWHTKILKVCPNIPIVLVANKTDACKFDRDCRFSGYHLYNYQISCKNTDDTPIHLLVNPFMWLVGELFGRSVEFICVNRPLMSVNTYGCDDPVKINKWDQELNTIPLFVPFKRDDLLIFSADLPKSCPLNHDLPADEFGYKKGSLDSNIALIYMPKLIEFLRDWFTLEDIEAFIHMRIK